MAGPDDAHELLELESRRRIYQRVRAVPGIHFRELQRQLGVSVGTLEYNLHQLESAGLLVTREDGRLKSYFVREDLDRRDRDVLHYLRQETPRRIAMLAAAEPGIRFQELAKRLGIFPSRVSSITRRLVKGGVLLEESVGREKAFRAAEPERVKRLIVQYRQSFLDAMVDRFASTWLDT